MMNIFKFFKKQKISPAPDSPPDSDHDYRSILYVGGIVLIGGFLSLIIWAFWFDLDQGVPSTGSTVLDGHRKIITHSTGGVIRQIHARDGQSVIAGDTLVEFDDAQVRASLEALRAEWLNASMGLHRLLSERQGQSTVDFPAEVLNLIESSNQYMDLKRYHLSLFDSSRSSFKLDILEIEKSKAALELQQKKLTDLYRSRLQQKELVDEQLEAFKGLEQSGFFSKSALKDRMRQRSEIESEINEALVSLEDNRFRASELDARLTALKSQYFLRIDREIVDLRSRLDILTKRIDSAIDVLSKLELKAPVDGVVMGVRFHTVGAAVRPGETVLEIVPEDDIVIDARFSPVFVDLVRMGMPADVYLDSYISGQPRRLVAGTVVFVSPDTLYDQAQGGYFIHTKVRLNRDQIDSSIFDSIRPGMVATVVVKAGNRSVISYFTTPLTRWLNQALLEP